MSSDSIERYQGWLLFDPANFAMPQDPFLLPIGPSTRNWDAMQAERDWLYELGYTRQTANLAIRREGRYVPWVVTKLGLGGVIVNDYIGEVEKKAYTNSPHASQHMLIHALVVEDVEGFSTYVHKLREGVMGLRLGGAETSRAIADLVVGQVANTREVWQRQDYPEAKVFNNPTIR